MEARLNRLREEPGNERPMGRVPSDATRLKKEWNKNRIEHRESNEKRLSIEDLLEELPEEEIEEFDIKQDAEISGEISQMYVKVCEQEKIVFIEKRKMLEIYYEFGKRFEEKLEILLEEYHKEPTAINKLINEILEGGINHNRRSILRKLGKVRKIYRIISANGGKEKIRRLKHLNSEDYLKFSYKGIEEWVKNH